MPLSAKVRKFKVELNLNSSWVDVSADLRTRVPISVSYGIFGHSPLDRLASEGVLNFALDNSKANSGGVVGYYAPGSSSVRAGFELGVLARFTILFGVYYDTELYDTFTYGTHAIKFRGRVVDIVVDPDPKGPRTTTCTAKDFIYLMAQHKMSLVAVKTNRRSDLAFSDVVGDMATQPQSTSYGTGQETFAYALDDMKDEKSSAVTAAQKVVLSEFGYGYRKGDESTGEVLVFENRHKRVGETADYDVSAEPVLSYDVTRPLDLIYNRIKTTSFPREIGASPEVLYDLQTDMEIAAGATQTIEARYTDPNSRSTRISATSLITPTGTDFQFGSSAGGGADDIHAQLGIVATFGANSASLALTNNAGVPGFVNKLQIRGTAIRLYEPVLITAENAASQTSYDLRELLLTLPYQNNPLVAKDFGDLTLSTYKDPHNYVRGLTFAAPKSVALGNAVSRAEPGDRVTVPANVPTGISSSDYFIHGVKLDAIPPDILLASWSLVVASAASNWLLGHATLGLLGTTSILGV